MHLDYELPGGETIRQRLERDRRAIDALLADPNLGLDELVLERLPNGQFAGLRPETDRRYVVTDKGRAALGAA
jgi:hypothetical protein